MIYRDLDPTSKLDLDQADAITGRNQSGDVRLSQDYITVACDDAGTFHGLAAGRPVLFVHEFLVRPSIVSRHVADCLLQYSLGKLAALGERQIHFLIADENTSFQEFVREQKGWSQRNGQIWTMNVPRSHYPRR